MSSYFFFPIKFKIVMFLLIFVDFILVSLFSYTDNLTIIINIITYLF